MDLGVDVQLYSSIATGEPSIIGGISGVITTGEYLPFTPISAPSGPVPTLILTLIESLAWQVPEKRLHRRPRKMSEKRIYSTWCYFFNLGTETACKRLDRLPTPKQVGYCRVCPAIGALPHLIIIPRRRPLASANHDGTSRSRSQSHP
jgi:hypothetical protein